MSRVFELGYSLIKYRSEVFQLFRNQSPPFEMGKFAVDFFEKA